MQTQTNKIFDIAIIGAGIVGCAMARRFTLEGVRVVVLDKACDILDGASKANSAILHTGFDALTGSIELSCIRNGYKEYHEIHQELGLPLQRVGAHVVAWNDEQFEMLGEIKAKAHINGVTDVEIIDAQTLRKKEPNLSQSARGAIVVPGESIIDPWTAAYAYLHQALDNGAEFYRSWELKKGDFIDGVWHLHNSIGSLQAKQIINCAGLYGDRVDQALLGESTFTITPRKGQFIVYDKAASNIINSIILPVPTFITKGVVVCQTIFGNVLVGPTAEDQLSRVDASTEESALKKLIASGIEKFPLLKNYPVTATYAGLRPACEFKDYQIQSKPNKNWITVGAIRSTGLSASLGIASYVFKLYTQTGATHEKIQTPMVPLSPVLAENLDRDWTSGNYGEIVCHCELVTQREIEQALKGPLAAKSLSGLKRQTRATMGRCQGFYCLARLSELTEGKFINPISIGKCQ